MAVAAVISVAVLRRQIVHNSWKVILTIYVPIMSLSWAMLIASGPHWPFWMAIPLALGAIAISFGHQRWLRVLGWGFICVLGVICISIAWHWGSDNIDVFRISQQGSLDFLRGLNPYQLWFGSTTIGVTRFHYDYGPLWLLLTSPFALIGDVRVLIALSSVGIVALGVWKSGWRRNETWMWVALLVLSPWLVWGTLMSWTELTMMALLLAWYATREQWRWSWLFLAVALGSNPVIGILLLPLFVIMPEVRRQVIYAVAAAAVCWLGAWALSGHDFLQAFAIAGGQGYNPTIGLSGLYWLVTHQFLPKVVTVAIVIAVSCWMWHARAYSLWQRELLAGAGAMVIVWCMPAGYFEYALIPALWLWWAMRTQALSPVSMPLKTKGPGILAEMGGGSNEQVAELNLGERARGGSPQMHSG
jgi:hypothetical protein